MLRAVKRHDVPIVQCKEQNQIKIYLCLASMMNTSSLHLACKDDKETARVYEHLTKDKAMMQLKQRTKMQQQQQQQ